VLKLILQFFDLLVSLGSLFLGFLLLLIIQLLVTFLFDLFLLEFLDLVLLLLSFFLLFDEFGIKLGDFSTESGLGKFEIIYLSLLGVDLLLELFETSDEFADLIVVTK